MLEVLGGDNGVHTNVELDVEDEEWHQVKHKIKGKGVAMQRDKKILMVRHYPEII